MNAPSPEKETGTGIILCARPADERRRYIVTSSLIGWVHTQNDPCRNCSIFLRLSFMVHCFCVGLTIIWQFFSLQPNGQSGEANTGTEDGQWYHYGEVGERGKQTNKKTAPDVNTLRPRQNGRHLPDNIVKSIFLNENVLTLNVWGRSYLGLTRSISWLLIPWLLTSPGHQQPWYWLC